MTALSCILVAMCCTVQPSSAVVAIEKPYFRWLFGGFGFQNSEANFLAIMPDDFRDQRVLKTFAELSPTFSRVFAGFADSSKEQLDRFADYYDLTFRKAGTTLYAVPCVMPSFADTFDVDEYAEKVAQNLEYLVKARKCRKLRYYCLTNELMCGDHWSWFVQDGRRELFGKFYAALFHAFRRHGLDILLLASDAWPVPTWPPATTVSPLCGSRKPDMQIPIVICDVPKCAMTLKTGLFNREVELIVEADGQTFFSRYYRPAPKAPGWTNLIERAGGKEWAGELVEPIRIDVPACQRLSMRIGRGDWLEVLAVELSAGGKTAVLPLRHTFPVTSRHDMRFVGFDAVEPFRLADGTDYTGDVFLDDTTSVFWKPVLDAGQFVMVGETGAFNKTPHEVSLRWLEDNLRRWKEKGVGWAMWNFRGSMGILDSGRTDVKYENYQGHKLDRKMLKLLQRY